ncbi:transglutaminase family protein [Nakamurella leprariae]|uniref:Transglutaminase domain-containing protein n=1 Tax=Nakamurella leprariae TaxID=2803911 RepID=A0A939C3B5_9ACTN|nr:DUF3488 and transglutaminase-like domain-containing protein [Nakamurella leprariae]MBM9469239.1 transglutaminase domain-containing protein [Nakamurella leprariae]
MTVTAPPEHDGPIPVGAYPAGPPPDDGHPQVAALATAIGALAVLAGSSALATQLSGTSWLTSLVVVLTVIWLVGVGGRLLRLPSAVVVLVQLATLAVTLTGLFVTGATWGVLPDPHAWAEGRELLAGAWDQVLTTVAPAPVTPELSFLICLSVGLAAVVVDLLIAVAGAPGLVALPLLCLYSVPASISGVMLPWPAFVLPAVAYVLLLLVTGAAGRVTGWRPAAGVGAAAVPIATMAAVLALVGAAASTGVGTEGRLPQAEGGGSSGIGLSPFTSLRGDLERADPVDLMRVSGLPTPDYLRTVGLESWTPDQGWSVDELQDSGSLSTDVTPGPDEVTLDITVTNLRERFLPVYQATSAVSGLGSGWTYDAELQAVFREDPVDVDSYRLTKSTAMAGASALRADTVTADPRLLDTGAMPEEVVAQAWAVVAAATTPFDQALALQQFFTDPANGFVYSLSVPTGNTGDALLDFLQNRQGYCEQYASAMAVMARAVGLPTRVAVGFTQGDRQADGSYLINSHDAHAWVEVRFDAAGWVRFDPTPLTGGQGGQQGFFDDTAQAPSTAPTTEGVTPTSDAAVTSGDLGIPEPAPGMEPLLDSSPPVPTDESGSGSLLAVLGWTVGIVAVLAALAATPTLVRGLRRRRRLTVIEAGGPQAPLAAWAEVEDAAADHGVAMSSAESLRSAANRLARVARLDGDDRDELRMLVLDTERACYAAPVGTADPVVGAVPVGTSRAAAALSSGSTAVAGAAGVAVADRAGGSATGALLAERVRRITAAIARGRPQRLSDRLLPRSVRPPRWR